MAGDGWLSRRVFLIVGGVAASGSLLLLWLRELFAGPDGSPVSTVTHHSSATTTARPDDGPSTTPSVTSAEPVNWSDADAWPDGEVPGSDSAPTIDRAVILDVDVEVAGLTIGETGSLTFDPQATRKLVSTGNIVVHGRLAMAPADARTTHRIVFSGVNERGFVGDGMEPLESDTGLWIMGSGMAELAGTPRLGWTRARTSLSSGETVIEVEDDPSGWRPGDEIVVTPTAPPRGDGSENGFDVATIASVSGRTIRLRAAIRRDHPRVEVGGERTFGAEVLNLTRNVRIEGTDKGRAHVMVHSARPQSIRHAALRHLGPRQPDSEFTEGVLGRYPLHFHLCENGSRGSVVEGTVVRDTGNHAFVAHTSHGVTFRDCISFDTYDEPYWWDQAPSTRISGPPTDDTTYDRCVAALAKYDPPFRGYRLTGFSMSRGRGNVARGCVAVGIQGNGDASGFHWAEGSEGIWIFEDNVVHNSVNGIFTWQNTGEVHVITDFVAYHNDGYGIAHGAYGNPYLYKDSILHGNAEGAILMHAVARDDGLRFTNLICDGAGESDHLVVSAKHVFDGDLPTRFTGCRFRGAREASFGVVYEGDNGDGEADLIEVIDCTFDGNEFWLADNINPRTEVRVRDQSHGRLTLRRRDQAGDYRESWNASVTPA